MIPAASNRTQQAGNGVTTAFSFTFAFYDPTHIYAWLTDSSGNNTLLVLGTDYTLSTVNVVGGAQGGTLTATVAPATGYSLTIVRIVPLAQTQHYIGGGNFPSASTETTLDLLVMMAQQHLTLIKGCLKTGWTDLSTIADLPNAVNRAGGLVGFDTNGLVKTYLAADFVGPTGPTGPAGANGTGTVNSVAIASTDLSSTGGPITTTGTITLNINSNAVTNAKLAQMATTTIKGNSTGGTANAADLSATTVTAMLNSMVGDTGAGGTKGLVPVPASGTAAAGKFLKADGTWAVPSGTSSGASTLVQLTGSGNWTCPAGVTKAKVTCVGAGGGGGGGASGQSASGGGSGQVTQSYYTTLVPGTNYAYAVGAAGAAGTTSGTAGGAGGDTVFTGPSTQTAKGGLGGGAGVSSGTVAGGLGGSTGGTGNLIYNGFPGQAGGTNGGGVAVCGWGGDAPLGYGQGGRLLLSWGATTTGAAGSGYGAGGSAGQLIGAGALGAIGTLVIEY